MGRIQKDAIITPRLLLTPLRRRDAAEMSAVLADIELYEFMGGHPANRVELETRYALLEDGSPHPDQIWLNWIVRRRPDGMALGMMQATLLRGLDGWDAQIAWVIGLNWQGQGFATEAARAVIVWLYSNGVKDITANVHPNHRASCKVAASAGMVITNEEKAGERVWWHPGPPTEG